jgi:RNA polymerase sigma-70 factor (ECF subfamily)
MPRPGARLAALSEATLAAMAAGGDRDAFAALLPRVSPPVRALLRRMGAQPALADDVTQDALLTAYRRIATYRGEAAFTSWVMRIAARLYFRQRRRGARIDTVAEPDDAQTPAHGPDSDARLDLDRALAQLSEAERVCVSLCHGAGMTQTEIAAMTGLKLGTVKSHVTRGLEKLRRLMTSGGGDLSGART